MNVRTVDSNNPRIQNFIPSRFPLKQDPQDIDFQGVKVTADFKILRTMINGKIRGLYVDEGKHTALTVCGSWRITIQRKGLVTCSG